MDAGGATWVFGQIDDGINAGGAHVPEVALHDDLLPRASEEDAPDGGVANFLELSGMTMEAGAEAFRFEFVGDFVHGVGHVLDGLFVFFGVVGKAAKKARRDEAGVSDGFCKFDSFCEVVAPLRIGGPMRPATFEA